jgi:hypothetical protein
MAEEIKPPLSLPFIQSPFRRRNLLPSILAKQEIDEPTTVQDFYIAVFGDASSGKSSFIAKCAGKPIEVKHDLKIGMSPFHSTGRYYLTRRYRRSC